MSKILIVGNVLKDVYLKLDERQNDFELDGGGISWLELGFNGAAHSFLKRTSVYGGAAVSLSVLSKLGVDAGILNSKTEFKPGEVLWSDDPADYRYIFCHRGGITYFVPSERKATDWSMPTGTPNWILVDRSTKISTRLVDELQNFLKFSRGTKLAVHAEKYVTPAGQRLSEMADILFVEDEPPVRTEEKIVDKIELDKPDTQLVCHISPRKIALGEAEESWNIEDADVMTHLTVYSTIVATVLGVVAAGGTPAEALLLARLNAEHATIDGSLAVEKLRELAQEELKKRSNLKLIARSLMTSGKGVLAIDESSKNLAKRFSKYGIVNSSANRKDFYRMMLATPSLREYVSGVILSEENARYKFANGETAVEFLTNRGVIPGVKVDLGLRLMAGSSETHTLGIEGLAKRLRGYYKQGFRFAKWRAAFQIGKDEPSFFAVEQNADELASFARECQLTGLVPVIEPDIVSDGDFAIEKHAEVTARVLTRVFEKLEQRHVMLGGCILKCSMIVSGRKAEVQADASAVGMATAEILKHVVPRYVGGVWLLSGGQEPKQATKNLTAVMQCSPFVWPVTFAFSRALEEPVLATWHGDMAQVKAAQAALERHLEASADALHYGKFEGAGGSGGVTSIGVLDWS